LFSLSAFSSFVLLRALVHGAVISAFLTIAQAMSDQGCV
jgi:hypothetical protein